ncbi:MAG: GTP-binding protein [Clostridium sp.]|nr:GTP-binding protein [Clostridium sp.]
MSEDRMPLFLINGFLEAGKTQFIRFTMQQDYFRTEGKTLLIVCEEGEEEYDDELLKDTKTSVVYVDELSKLTPDYLEELEIFYNPERVLMEWNGMWDLNELKLPKDWDLYQQITIIDGSTLDLYLNNMKPLVGNMVRNTEMIIVNRCDEIEDLEPYRRTLKGMNPQVQIVFEDEDGEIEEVSEADLPYDMSADVIEIPPEAYGIWYIDALDRPDRYRGKTVEFTAMVLKAPEFPKNYFVPGRMAMTCCEADMTFLGFMCKARNARLLESREWVKVRARIEYEYSPEYEGEGPMLYADYVEKAEEIKEIVQF